MVFSYKTKSLRNFRRIAAAWNAESDLEAMVAGYHGKIVNKWRHFYSIYSRHFGHLRGQAPRILEIGLGYGGSLELWRRYFGPDTHLTGLDNNPEVKGFEEAGARIYVGDQGDVELLRRIAEERGPFDLIIEDGSHQCKHQIMAFETLFPHVTDRGSYACEDIQTSYMADEEFGGGLRQPGTFVEYAKTLIDEQHAWFSEKFTGQPPGELARSIYAIHFYPCLALIERRAMEEPMNWRVGRLL